MIENASGFRAQARMSLSGKWREACLFVLLTLLVVIGSSVFIVLLGIPLFPFIYHHNNYFLKIARGEEVKIGYIFENYIDVLKDITLTYLRMYLYLFLWTILLVIPGIIKAYSYAMVPYIVHDRPDLRGVEAITASREMMDGHKWELFCLDFSFIGWALLSPFTLGFGMIPLTAYFKQARAEFYLALNAEQSAPSVTPEQFLMRSPVNRPKERDNEIDPGSLNWKLDSINSVPPVSSQPMSSQPMSSQPMPPQSRPPVSNAGWQPGMGGSGRPPVPPPKTRGDSSFDTNLNEFLG